MLSRVESWLKEIGLGAYSQVFVDNHITEDLLFSITEADLEKMEFSVGHRLTFFRALQRLQEPATEVGTEPTECSTQAELQSERRLLSILFCDVVDSTRLSQLLDAEEVNDVMAEYYRSCDAIAQRLKGSLVATQGDGVLCCFGWPQAHEDDAMRAIHAGLEMIVQIPKHKVPHVPEWKLDVRVGIATGTVIIDGSNRYGKLQISGETPNLADRLKGACPPAAVVIDSLTKKLVGANFELEELGQHSLKGFGEPIQVCKVIAPRYGLTRFEGMHPDRPAPLIGRQSELDLLISRWQVIKQGESQTILLTGPAGIGKSRLAASMIEFAAEDQCHVQVYQCSSTNQNTALYCLINRIMRDAKVKLSDEVEIRRAKLTAFLDEALRPAQESFGSIASLLSIPAHAGEKANEMMPEQWKAAVFDAIVAELVHLAKSKPVIVLFEDIHWIDPTSLELLDTILHRCKRLPVLILMSSRLANIGERLTGLHSLTQLHLNPLPLLHSRQLCRSLIGEDPIPEDRVERIIEAAQGLPLFIEELVKLSDSATLTQWPAHQQRTPAGLHSLKVPEQLLAFLAERLDGLDATKGTKQVAQIAAVFGREFDVETLRKASSLAGINVERAIDELISSRIVVSTGQTAAETFDFRHALLREATYFSLLRRVRQRLHGEIGNLLTAQHPEVADSEPEVIAYHLTEAGAGQQAIPYWAKAGERANEQSATMEAFNHFSTGLSLLDPLPEGKEKYELELTLRVGFGAAALAIEGHSADDIERNYSRILELAEILENPRERFRAHLGLGAFCYVGGDMEKGREHCEMCLNLAQFSGDREELLHAHRIMCELCFYLGEFRNSCDHRDKCISLYRKSEHIQLARELGDDPVVIASMYKALSLWFLGFPDKAIAVCREGLSLAYELKHAFTIAQAEFYAAWLHAYLRDYETAEQHAARAIKICEVHAYSMYLGLSRVIYGWAMTMRGGHKQGETEIKEGLDLIRGPNADVCESCFLLFFAEHSLLLGENERGLSIIQEAKTVASERFAEPERTRIEAELRAGENKEIAEQGFLKALDLARKQESLSLELRVALSLCRLLSEANRAGEGMRILKDVYERFTEGFKTCDLRVARTELKLGG